MSVSAYKGPTRVALDSSRRGMPETPRGMSENVSFDAGTVFDAELSSSKVGPGGGRGALIRFSTVCSNRAEAAAGIRGGGGVFWRLT